MVRTQTLAAPTRSLVGSTGPQQKRKDLVRTRLVAAARARNFGSDVTQAARRM